MAAKLMPSIQIDDNLSISGNKTAIIAEVGINHKGDASLAKEMIVSAWDNGADFVKLQSFVTENFFAEDLSYFKETQKLELGFKAQRDLFVFAKEQGIRLFTTPFDYETLEFLDEFDLPAYKIASMDCNNYPLIEAVAKRQKPVILSTGMATLEEVKEAVNTIKNAGNEKIILLHCVSDYPTRPKDSNLSYMHTLKEMFKDIPCGISEHTIGMDAAYLSVGMDACIVEKHFKICEDGGDQDHPDLIVSMTPKGLKKFSQFCKKAAVLRGDGKESLTDNEKKGRKDFRRGIYASCDINKGDVFSEKNLIALRPLRGIPASSWKRTLGKKSTAFFKKGDPIFNPL